MLHSIFLSALESSENFAKNIQILSDSLLSDEYCINVLKYDCVVKEGWRWSEHAFRYLPDYNDRKVVTLIGVKPNCLTFKFWYRDDGARWEPVSTDIPIDTAFDNYLLELRIYEASVELEKSRIAKEHKIVEDSKLESEKQLFDMATKLGFEISRKV